MIFFQLLDLVIYKGAAIHYQSACKASLLRDWSTLVTRRLSPKIFQESGNICYYCGL